jgi:hypothetical protein
MKRVISLILIVLLTQLFFVRPTFAGTKEEKFAEKVKTEIAKLGTGQDAKIKVKLKDGTKIKGYVSEISESQFTVINEKTGQATQVPYPQVKQAKGNNLSGGVVIAIAVVAAIAFIIFAASQLK